MRYATEKQIKFATQISELLNIPLPDVHSFDAINTFIQQNFSNYTAEHNRRVGERIKSEISILDYVPIAGLTLKPIGGQGLYTTVEHDSMRIDPRKNCYYFNSRADADSVIGFVAKYIYDGDFSAAIKDLTARLDNQEFPVSSSTVINQRLHSDATKELQLPLPGNNMRRVFAYLTKTRYIDPDIVQHFVDNKMLYQDTYGNCVFLSYENDRPVFSNLHGTNTYRRFVGDVKGCDYLRGFFIDNQSNNLIVTESIIDAMSIMTILKKKDIDFCKYDYLQLSGNTKLNSLYYHIENQSISNILLSLDNDNGGRSATNKIIVGLQTEYQNVTFSIHIPAAKDWNQELIDYINRGKSPADIDFFAPHTDGRLQPQKTSLTNKKLIER